jgi:hypothetical protein
MHQAGEYGLSCETAPFRASGQMSQVFGGRAHASEDRSIGLGCLPLPPWSRLAGALAAPGAYASRTAASLRAAGPECRMSMCTLRRSCRRNRCALRPARVGLRRSFAYALADAESGSTRGADVQRDVQALRQPGAGDGARRFKARSIAATGRQLDSDRGDRAHAGNF